MVEEKLTTLDDAIKELNIHDPAEANTVFKTNGITPESIAKHTLAKEYIMMGMPPEQFMELHAGTPFDMTETVKLFSEVCKDFTEPLILGQKSKAIEFCSMMMYKVAPESRSVKKGSGDKTWKFYFPYAHKVKKMVTIEEKQVEKEVEQMTINVAFVSTYKAGGKIEQNQSLVNVSKRICLTVKHACLLAMFTFSKLVEYGMKLEDPKYLLSPLAGAIFTKEDIIAIATEMKIEPVMVLKIVNCSAQSAGQYLPVSDVDCAAVCAIVATAGMKEETSRHPIIKKTIKQYLSLHKKHSKENFIIYCKHASGGLPADMKPDVLIKLFNETQEAQLKARDVVAAAKATIVTSVVEVPASLAKSSGRDISSDSGPHKPTAPDNTEDNGN